jgi:general secretion pathway protein C
VRGQHSAVRSNFDLLRRSLRGVVVLLAAVWVASSLLAGAALFRGADSREAATAAPRPVARASREPIDIDTVAGWNLFGDAAAASTRTSASLDGIEAASADTTLDLELQGVIVANDSTEGSIIVQVNGAERRYRVGDELPVGNQVSVAKVLPDRAVLRNGNRFETLRLYAAPTRTADGSAAIAPRNETQAPTAQDAPDAVVVLADVIDVAEHRSGDRVVGYRATPGRHAALFEQIGLQPGDVITAVNGIDFEASGATLEHYNPLQLSPDATLVIRRGTEQMTLFVATDS